VQIITKQASAFTGISNMNLMAYSESGIPISYSSLILTTALSHLVSEIFACATETDWQIKTQTIIVLKIIIS